jgi:hypothetical protein
LFFVRSNFFIELLAFRLHFNFFFHADLFDELLTNFVSQALDQFLSASFLLNFCLYKPALFVIFFLTVLCKVFQVLQALVVQLNLRLLFIHSLRFRCELRRESLMRARNTRFRRHFNFGLLEVAIDSAKLVLKKAV